jgi:hypothetical protein
VGSPDARGESTGDCAHPLRVAAEQRGAVLQLISGNKRDYDSNVRGIYFYDHNPEANRIELRFIY